MGIQIQKKSPPILNIEKNTSREDKTEFAYKNLLAERWKSDNLDYARQNDIYKFRAYEEEIKTVTECDECTYAQLSDKMEELRNLRAKFTNKSAFLSQAVDKKILYDASEINLKELIEIERFTNALSEYVNFFSGIIKKMNEIRQA